MIGGRRPLKGRKPADRRVRVERPHSAFFRYAGPGTLVAKRAANQPKTGLGRAWVGFGADVERTEDFALAFYEAVASGLPAIFELSFSP